MDRTLLGVLAGLVLGIGLGFVFFSSSGGRGTTAPARPGSTPQEVARERDEPPLPLSDEGLAPVQEAEPVAVEAALAPLSETRVQESPARVEVSATASWHGTEELWGRVEDLSGTGVAGVVIRASAHVARDRLLKSADIGQDAPELSMEETLRKAAQRYTDARARRFQATTDVDGRFRFTGLPENDFHFEAYKRDYIVRPRNEQAWSVPAGSEVNFVATALVEVTVRITLPDGTEPNEAVVLCGVVRGGRTREDRWAWSPSGNVLRLPATEVELTATVDVASISSVDVDEADMRSEGVVLRLTPGTPRAVDLVLEGRSGIRGRVLFPKDMVPASNVLIRLLALGSATEVNLASLAEAEPVQWVQGLGDFAFLDIEPGFYALGITRSWNAPVEVNQIVEVGGGIESCVLELPPIDPADYLVARVFGPDGSQLRDVRFRFRHEREDGGSSSFGVGGLPGEDGSYFTSVPLHSRASYYGEPTSLERFSLEAEHEQHGTKVQELTPGQGEVEFRFSEAAQLEVFVAGYQGGDYGGRVAIEVRNELERSARLPRGDPESVGPSAVVRLDALVPGVYELALVLREPGSRHYSRYAITTETVEVRAGENFARITMPTLYPLEVVVPLAGESTRLSLHVIEGEDGAMTSRGRASCDAKGRALFDGLPAGEYALYARGGQIGGRMRLTIPSGEVVFTPDEN